MKVILSEEAERDLERISDSIAIDNPARARSFSSELVQSAHGLATMPNRFPLVDGQPADGIRRRVHGSYGIFYKVGGNRVDVVRILHSARDYEAAFAQN